MKHAALPKEVAFVPLQALLPFLAQGQSGLQAFNLPAPPSAAPARTAA